MPSRKLNIGCGSKPLKGYTNLDIIVHDGVDVICDIEQGLPFSGEEFDEVVADYVLCQICSPKAFMGVMNDIWKILKVGGVLKLRVPNANYPCAFQDPMDCRRFVPETFDYFDKDHYRYKMFDYGFKPWKVLKVKPEREDRLYVEMKKCQ
jgi:predicted SAM-dependent methyltransferase